MAERGARTLALDPGAAFAVHGGLRAHLDAAAIVDAGAIVDGCRMCKSAAELALIQQACDMTLEVQRLAAGIAREGIGSDELARFIDQAHRALGADDGSTFCIVQFGHATAYPHGLPGVQHLREGDLVLIDTGCTVHGYHSDITRTWIYGRPGDEQRRIWALERAAQAAAFDAVRPGVACEDVDAAARRVLEAAGLGPGYRLPGLPHRTGHGCGLAIHEAPYLVRGNRTALQPGMCASDEPMIVVPGRFGVRLEDHFHVTADGAQWFTPPPRPSIARSPDAHAARTPFPADPVPLPKQVTHGSTRQVPQDPQPDRPDLHRARLDLRLRLAVRRQPRFVHGKPGRYPVVGVRRARGVPAGPGVLRAGCGAAARRMGWCATRSTRTGRCWAR